tara:strand:- start:25426 stop:25695 length:270 start_codon:yes stop_codon:yes gene_type:complete
MNLPPGDERLNRVPQRRPQPVPDWAFWLAIWAIVAIAWTAGSYAIARNGDEWTLYKWRKSHPITARLLDKISDTGDTLRTPPRPTGSRP